MASPSSSPYPLPLPTAGRIREVIHVSDVHIPFLRGVVEDCFGGGGGGVSDERAYEAEDPTWRSHRHAFVIAQLVRAVWKRQSVREGCAVVVVTGDVLDNKHAANTTTVALLHALVRGLCTGNIHESRGDEGARGRVPVYVIPGNHDVALEDSDGAGHSSSPDLLGALLAPCEAAYPVAYLRRSGVYGTLGSGALFGVLHVRDSVRPRSSTNSPRACEDMPWHLLRLPPPSSARAAAADDDASCEPENGKGRDVAFLLYHGAVCGGGGGGGVAGERERERHCAASAPNNIPMQARGLGYDACLLGDIHTMHVHGVSAAEKETEMETEEHGARDEGCIATFDWEEARPPSQPPPPPDPSPPHAATSAQTTVVNRRRQRVPSTTANAPASRATCPWAYAGSLLQLTAGERLYPHGFLAWDLARRKVSAHHLHNPFGILVLDAQPREDNGNHHHHARSTETENETESAGAENGGEDSIVGGRILIQNAFAPVHAGNSVPAPPTLLGDGPSAADDEPSLLLPSPLPRNVLVRFAAHVSVSPRDAERLFAALRSRRGMRAVGWCSRAADAASSQLPPPQRGGEGAPSSSSPSMPSAEPECPPVPLARAFRCAAGAGIPRIDLSAFGKVDAWIDYARENVRDSERARTFATWLRHPTSLTVPAADAGHDEGDGDFVAKKTRERNAKLLKKCEELVRTITENEMRATSSATTPRRFKLLRLEWAWMLCYGDHNAFDFERLDGRVGLLSAPNGGGKSSMLEVLCIALYGAPMSSRGGKGSLGEALCRDRPSPNTPGTCSVDVELLPSGERFRVSRSFVQVQSAAATKLSATARVSKITAPHGVCVVCKDGLTAAHAWTQAHLGSAQSFLLCSLLTQHNDADFFAMRATEQRALLDDALALEAAKRATETLKEARLAHAAVGDTLQTALAMTAQDAHATAERTLRRLALDIPSRDASAHDVAQFVRDAAARFHAAACEAKARKERADRRWAEAYGRVEHGAWRLDACQRFEQEIAVSPDVVAPAEEEEEASLGSDGDEKEEDDARARAEEVGARELAYKVRAWHAAVHQQQQQGDGAAAAAASAAPSLPPESGGAEALDAALAAANAERARASEEMERAGPLMTTLSVADIPTDAPAWSEQQYAGARAELERREKHERAHAQQHRGENVAPVMDEEQIGSMFVRVKEALQRARSARQACEDLRRACCSARHPQDREEADPTEDVSEDVSADADAGGEHDYEAEFRAWKRARVALLQRARDEGGVSLGSAGEELIARGGESGPDAEEYEEARAGEAFGRLQRAAEDALDAWDASTYVQRVRARRQRRMRAPQEDDEGDGEDDGAGAEPFNPDCWACRRRAAAEKQPPEGMAAMTDGEVDERCACAAATATRLRDMCRAWRSSAFDTSTGSRAVWRRWRLGAKRLRLRREAECRAAEEEALAAHARAADLKETYHAELGRREARKTWLSTCAETRELRTALEAEDARRRVHRARELRLRWEESTRTVERLQRELELHKAYRQEHGAYSRDVSVLSRIVANARKRRARAERCLAENVRVKEDVERERAEADAAIQDALPAASELDACGNHLAAAARRSTTWRASLGVLEERRDGIAALGDLMDHYAAWVYTHRAIPALTREVNVLLAAMGVALRLEGACREEDAGALTWTLNGSPLYKCSGMQRFATSLAMRIALCQLGACTSTCVQLLIDEGFVTLDARNVAAVPEFLRESLLNSGRYVSVLLVTHLDGVRDAADLVVPIARYNGSGGVCRLVF